MSIKDFTEKIKPYWHEKAIPFVSKVKAALDLKEDIFIALAIILVGLAGFGLGKLSVMEKTREPVTIRPAQFSAITSSTTKNIKDTANNISEPAQSAKAMIAHDSAKGLLVAAKTGTKYYFPWCSGASRISEVNKVWFDSYEDAQKAGLTAAANCPNLK